MIKFEKRKSKFENTKLKYSYNFIIGILLILNTAYAARDMKFRENKSFYKDKPSNELQPFHKVIPISDGYVLDGIDGKITVQNNKWFFTVFEPLTDGKGFLTSTAEILPCSMLEKLTAIVDNNSSVRIWGKLTTYQNINYVYLSYFLQVKKAVEANEPNVPALQPELKDPNETQIIPDEALALLKPKRIISLTELKKPTGIESDGIIADRTGFLDFAKDGSYFGFDGIGRNVDGLQLPLLACQELEKMEKAQKDSAFPVRFKIFGIVTKYKNRNYLFLQRAAILYSNGNFAR